MIPLDRLLPEAVAGLDRDRPVIVYCYDHECDLSARAAALLAHYGFTDVYDYADSKTAWLGAGRASEGSILDRDRAGTLADRDIPTCGPKELLQDVPAFDEHLGFCVVVDQAGRVLGVVDERARTVKETRVDEVMVTSPTSVRPRILRDELARSMDRGGERYVLVTTSGGHLIGIVRRERLDHP